jgi:hypothetical protein
VNGVKERGHLPDGMKLIKRIPAPNQYYDVMLEGAMVGTSEHQDTWPRREYWLFTDIEGTQRRFAERHHHEGAAWLKGEYQDEAGPQAAPLATGGGFDPHSKRGKAVEAYAVEKIMVQFPQPPTRYATSVSSGRAMTSGSSAQTAASGISRPREPGLRTRS